jgi:phage anti-repressor protein
VNAHPQFPKISDRAVGDHLVKTVDGREVHGYLAAKKDYTTWMKDRIAKFGFVEDVDYVKVEDLSSPKSGSAKARAQTTTEYYLTIGMGKELGMIDRSDKGRAIRKYFLSIEEKSVTAPRPLTTTETLIQMLQLQADVERRQAAIVLRDENVFESVANCTIEGEHVLKLFLRSIMGEHFTMPVAVDETQAVNNGEN